MKTRIKPKRIPEFSNRTMEPEIENSENLISHFDELKISKLKESSDATDWIENLSMQSNHLHDLNKATMKHFVRHHHGEIQKTQEYFRHCMKPWTQVHGFYGMWEILFLLFQTKLMENTYVLHTAPDGTMFSSSLFYVCPNFRALMQLLAIGKSWKAGPNKTNVESFCVSKQVYPVPSE